MTSLAAANRALRTSIDEAVRLLGLAERMAAFGRIDSLLGEIRAFLAAHTKEGNRDAAERSHGRPL